MQRTTTRCAESLRAFADGRLDQWSGLPGTCSRSDAESTLGPSESGPDGVASLAGTLAGFRRYPPTGAAPYGVQIWLADDTIMAVEVVDARLPRPVVEMLGEPEAKERSGVGSVHTQWIYASRGVVLHIQNITGVVNRMYGFVPCSLEAFRALPWGRIEVQRRPLRPRGR